MCGMPVGYFKGHCTVVGVRRGKAILYPYDEVRAWFREWWLAQTGQSENDLGAQDWLNRFNEDDEDAA